MKLWSCSVVVLGVFVGLARAELGLMTTIMKGMHEACFVEELVEKTVIFIKHDASLLDVNTRQPISHIPFDLLLTVRDPQGHLVLRQQDKPNKGAFMTAALDGEYTICFQSMPSQFVANVGTRLSVEIFIGEDRDPRITAPIDVQLHDLSREIAESNKLIAHVELEQKLQREREANFRKTSEGMLSMTFYFAVLQTLVLAGTAVVQTRRLQKFFQYKKIV